MIVVDTNVLLYLWLRTDQSREVDELYARDPEWIAPMLWRSEFRNALLLYVRKEMMTFDQVMYAIERAEEQMQNHEHMVDAESVMRLAIESGCSAYDCEFVALAEALGVPLVTSDRRVLDRFPKIAQPLSDSIH